MSLWDGFVSARCIMQDAEGVSNYWADFSYSGRCFLGFGGTHLASGQALLVSGRGVLGFGRACLFLPGGSRIWKDLLVSGEGYLLDGRTLLFLERVTWDLAVPVFFWRGAVLFLEEVFWDLQGLCYFWRRFFGICKGLFF